MMRPAAAAMACARVHTCAIVLSLIERHASVVLPPGQLFHSGCVFAVAFALRACECSRETADTHGGFSLGAVRMVSNVDVVYYIAPTKSWPTFSCCLLLSLLRAVVRVTYLRTRARSRRRRRLMIANAITCAVQISAIGCLPGAGMSAVCH